MPIMARGRLVSWFGDFVAIVSTERLLLWVSFRTAFLRVLPPFALTFLRFLATFTFPLLPLFLMLLLALAIFPTLFFKPLLFLALPFS